MPAKTRSPVKSSLPSPTKLKGVSKKSAKSVVPVKTNVLTQLLKDADPKVVEARKSVNAQLVMRGVGKQIKKLGSRPMVLVTRHVVSKGISLKPVGAGVSKKKQDRKEVSKALNMEIQRVAGAKPSEVKARKEGAPAKISVNTEIVKKAVLSQLRGKKAASPTKRTKPAPLKVSSPTTKAGSSPKKTTATPKSPTTRSPVKRSPGVKTSPKKSDSPKK